MRLITTLLILAAGLSTSCAGWHQRRAAARTLEEVQRGIARLPPCPPALQGSAPGKLPPDAPAEVIVTVKGDIRIGLDQGRFVECRGNELTGCAPYTGPWVLRPAAGGTEHFQLHDSVGEVVGWWSREGAVQTLLDRWLAEVIATGKLLTPPTPEERARGHLRLLVVDKLCTTGPARSSR